MKNKFKRIYSGVLYAALAACMVTVVGVSAYTLFYDYNAVGDISLPHVNMPEVSFPDFNDDTSSGLPVDQNPDDVPGDVIDTQPETPVYADPVQMSGDSPDKIFTIASLIYSETMNDYRTHSGIDIAAELNAPVHAYTDGIIKEVYDDPFMGTTIVIEHEDALTTYYMNLAQTLPDGIQAGAEVKGGDVIGAVGVSAIIEADDGPHLHFEMRVNGKLIDPLPELGE